MLTALDKNTGAKEAKAQVLLKAVKGMKGKKKGFFLRIAVKKRLKNLRQRFSLPASS